MHTKNIIRAGEKITAGNKVMIMIHGRGGNAEDILSLSSHMNASGFSFLAPQATGNSWYPNSFLAPVEKNEPWLSSALQVLNDIVDDLHKEGIEDRNIYFAGFSQGACLTLEFVSRNAKQYGGVIAFTGGLIGEKINRSNYSGDFGGTKVFIGTSDPDPHVPVERVYATANILREMNAEVTEKIYPGMGHTINQDEIEQVNRIYFGKKA